MFNQILRRIQDKIRQRQYVMTLHAEEEMTDDNLSIYDVEVVILTGDILERQKDQNTNEWKYRISGQTLDKSDAEVIAKLGLTGKVVIITIYLC